MHRGPELSPSTVKKRSKEQEEAHCRFFFLKTLFESLKVVHPTKTGSIKTVANTTVLSVVKAAATCTHTFMAAEWPSEQDSWLARHHLLL
jgi:hypothetical protein